MPTPDSRTQPMLVTAFEPFDGTGLNASERILSALLAEPSVRAWPTGELVTAILPVAFEADVAAVEAEIVRHRPRLIVHLGQSSSSPSIAVERVGRNRKLCSNGSLTAIRPGAAAEYETTLPASALAAAMRAAGPEPIPVVESTDAGTYLCNHALYRSLHRAAVAAGPPAVFVHLPRLPEQAEILQRARADAVIATLPLAVSVRALAAGLAFLQSWEAPLSIPMDISEPPLADGSASGYHARMSNRISRRFWFTFENEKVNQPCIWMMSRKYPDVSFDIRQASVRSDIGIMAVLLEGEAAEVEAAVAYLRSLGVKVEPVEKNVLES